MSCLVRQIFSSTYKKLGCSNCFIVYKRHASCSTKRSGTSSQIHHAKVDPRFDPVGGASSKASFGQPTHLTHPHKIMEGEIVPGMREDDFRSRRHRLMEHIKTFSAKNNFTKMSHLIIIPSSQKKYMTEKIPYVFRQNSDFLYLTGCLEPDSILVIGSRANHKEESTLFMRGKDPHSELWDGPRTGIDQAVSFFGVDKSLPLSEFELFISSFMKDHNDCILWYDYVNDINPSVHKSMREFLSLAWNKFWESPRPFIHRLRLYKSATEQELMKKACEVGANAIKSVMKASRPLDNEAQIFARVDFECRMHGADYLAYPPVVAGGNRANIIHYINNDRVIQPGDLVLLDAGCEIHGYSSDITRTWPISGTFSPAQRILYEIVYAVQAELITMCNDFPSLDHLFNTMCRLLGVKLKDAGVISDKFTDKELTRAAYSFCPHHVSHYLGMDVHDTSSVPRNIPLEPGMVLTVEPGIYINLNNTLAGPEFRGQGIRIEDDVLMTSNGPLVLTSSCPKHPDDIEALLRESRKNHS